jgi:hypothetical protein
LDTASLLILITQGASERFTIAHGRPDSRTTTPAASSQAGVLTSERIWFDPAPHIADSKTLDVNIDPVRPNVTRRHLVAAALRQLEPTPRVVVRLPGPAGRCVARSAGDRPRCPTGSANGRAGTYGLTSWVCIRQAANRGVIGRPGRTLGC